MQKRDGGSRTHAKTQRRKEGGAGKQPDSHRGTETRRGIAATKEENLTTDKH